MKAHTSDTCPMGFCRDNTQAARINRCLYNGVRDVGELARLAGATTNRVHSHLTKARRVGWYAALTGGRSKSR